jgi:hypothetical protein
MVGGWRAFVFEKLCANYGISVLQKPHARLRIIMLNFRMSPRLTWSLCLTSVEERLTRH